MSPTSPLAPENVDEALFRQLLDSAPEAMVVVGPSGAIEYSNLRSEELFGYQREELRGQPIEVLIPERLRTAHVVHRRTFAADPKSRAMGVGLELAGRRKDGSEVAIEVSISPLRTPQGLFVSTAIRDLTARRRGEQMFRTLLESAPDAMVIVDLEGRIAILNAQTERLFGYPRCELLGETIEKLVPERMRGQHLFHRQTYAREPKSRSMGSGIELFAARKDGSEFPVEISLSPIDTLEAKVIAAAIRDVSERKRTEAVARLANDRLLSAIESMQGGIALYDANDALVHCNSSCRALFASSMDGPLVGVNYTHLIAAALRADLFELDGEAEEAFRARLLAYHRNPVGVLDVQITDGRFLRISERKTLEGGTVSTLWDVSDDVALIAERRRAQELAEAANNAKSQFLSSMSHELRTPLNSILGFAQLLQRDKKSPLNERQLEKLEYVLKGGEHLLRLIDDVLDLSRIESDHLTVSPEPAGIAEVLREVKATLDPMAAHATIQIAAPPQTTERVIADRTRLVQILINYGSNAIKYGKASGRMTFAVSRPNGGAVRISVQDDGIGIPEHQHAKIFQPFQRAGQEAGPIQGTGIGLTISRRLAELMGGSVGFQSVAGEGSTFWVELPAVQDEPTADHHSAVSSEAASSRLTEPAHLFAIVYVEDNPSNIAFMRELLADFVSVHLSTAPNAEVGVELVRSLKPDLVIMDINLPGISGYEATRQLQQWPETANIPVIALTAAAMLEDKRKLAEAGFYKYLSKPVRVTELLATLEELLLHDSKRGQRPDV